MTVDVLIQIINEKIEECCKMQHQMTQIDKGVKDNKIPLWVNNGLQNEIQDLREILDEYEKRKSPCKCTKWQAPTGGIPSYYTCKNCGHNFRYHVADTYRCEGEENKK